MRFKKRILCRRWEVPIRHLVISTRMDNVIGHRSYHLLQTSVYQAGQLHYKSIHFREL